MKSIKSFFAKKNFKNFKNMLKGRQNHLNRSIAGNSLLFVIMAVCGLFMAMPLIMLTNNALKPLDELYQYPPNIFVRNPTLTNFTDLFSLVNLSWVPFSRYIVNTIIITGISIAGHILCASLAAYPLAKHKFRGRDFLFGLVIMSMMFSSQVTQVSNYMVISALGLSNTYPAVILPTFAYGVGLYLLKQFTEQIPDSMIESARIDGASEWYISFHIIMPNIKPAWLTSAIFQFQVIWSNTGRLLLRDEELKPMQYALTQITASVGREGAAAAIAFVMALIPITFFLVCQSHIMETMISSGIKE
ncbi:ABC transporter permease [Clostridia bacterium]|nr:ABC transporter permease [Clostridia bacterium]